MRRPRILYQTHYRLRTTLEIDDDRRRGRLATLDRVIPIAAVCRAEPRHVAVIG
jgi:hypothetical protein